MVEIKTNKVNYIDSKKKNLLGPSIFLIVVVVLTVGLFLYNTYLQKQITDLKDKTISMEQTAAELQNKPEIQIFSLLDSNRRTIEELEKRSKITTYLDHLKSLELPENYDIKFEGFVLAKGEISTSAIVESTDKIAYEKTVNFIKGYREDEEALMNLNFIDLVEGMDTMKFNLSFTIK